MKITYFNTLHKRNETMIVLDTIEFKDGKVRFHSGGHGYEIRVELIVKIEMLEG